MYTFELYYFAVKLFANFLTFMLDFLFYQVYNVTKFLDDHPGGDEVLLSATGKVNSCNAFHI